MKEEGKTIPDGRSSNRNGLTADYKQIEHVFETCPEMNKLNLFISYKR